MSPAPSPMPDSKYTFYECIWYTWHLEHQSVWYTPWWFHSCEHCEVIPLNLGNTYHHTYLWFFCLEMTTLEICSFSRFQLCNITVSSSMDSSSEEAPGFSRETALVAIPTTSTPRLCPAHALPNTAFYLPDDPRSHRHILLSFWLIPEDLWWYLLPRSIFWTIEDIY